MPAASRVARRARRGEAPGCRFVSVPRDDRTDDRRPRRRRASLTDTAALAFLGSLGLVATRRPGLTGIWIGPRKVAALGVAVRRWVTYHGFALNVNAHLPHFAGIVPCGIAASDGTVTSLHAELGQTLDLAEVKTIVAREFRALWPAFLASGNAS